MNKYSSKAVKTAATVGMSLAMVLSNVAPVFAATSVGTITYCDTTTSKAGIKLANAIADALAKMGKDVTEVGKQTEIAVANMTELGKLVNETINATKTIDGILALTVKGLGDGSTTVADALGQAVLCDSTDDEYAVETAKHLVRKYDGTWTSFDDLVDAAVTEFKNLGTNASSYIPTIKSSDYDAAKELYDKLVVLVDYIDNLKATTSTSDIAAALKAHEDHWTDFKDAIGDYKETNESKFLNEYVKQLEDAPVANGKTVRDLVNKDADLGYKYVKTVENFIKNVKADKIDTIDATEYKNVKDADEVVDYMNGLQDIVDEMKDAADLLKSTNDSKKAYDKVADKVKVLADAIKARKGLTSSATQADIDDKETAIEKAINKFTAANLEAVQNYVEDVMNEFVTVKARKLSSGNYSLTFENADYGRYITAEDEFDENLTYLLLTTVVKDEEESYYDQLIANETSTKDSLIKAVTTDIEGITLGTNLTDTQAAKIIKAKKAYTELDYDGTNPYSLTAKEKRTVKENEELVDMLYKKLIWAGDVTATGWINKGNGDWDYIAEDGSRPSKWIASGANWYYVKNGTMLRNSWIASDAQGTRWYYVDDNGVMVSNTTVNGYTFNSYGVWVK